MLGHTCTDYFTSFKQYCNKFTVCLYGPFRLSGLIQLQLFFDQMENYF